MQAVLQFMFRTDKLGISVSNSSPPSVTVVGSAEAVAQDMRVGDVVIACESSTCGRVEVQTQCQLVAAVERAGRPVTLFAQRPATGAATMVDEDEEERRSQARVAIEQEVEARRAAEEARRVAFKHEAEARRAAEEESRRHTWLALEELEQEARRAALHENAETNKRRLADRAAVGDEQRAKAARQLAVEEAAAELAGKRQREHDEGEQAVARMAARAKVEAEAQAWAQGQAEFQAEATNRQLAARAAIQAGLAAAADAERAAGRVAVQHAEAESGRADAEQQATHVRGLLRDSMAEADQLRAELNQVRGDLEAAKTDNTKLADALMQSHEVAERASGGGIGEGATATQQLRSEVQSQLAKTVNEEASGGGTTRRVFKGTKIAALLGIILLFGGMMLTSLVSSVIGGPKADTVKQWRQDSPQLKPGTSWDSISFNVWNIAIPMLAKYELTDSLFMLTEDGSSLKKGLDFAKVKDPATGTKSVWVYGLGRGPRSITTVTEVATALLAETLATTLYVVALIPLVEHAPVIPIVIDTNDNTFTRIDVLTTNAKILAAFALAGLQSQIIGSVSDGDSRLRNQVLAMEYHKGDVAERYISFNHPYIMLRLPWIKGHGFWCQDMDWLHIVWRLRNLYIDRKLIFCGHNLDKENLYKAGPHITGLRAQDLNGSDKQNYEAIKRLASVNDDGEGLDIDMIAALWPQEDFRPDAMYWLFVRKFLCIFISDAPVKEKLEMAGWVLGYLALMKMMIGKEKDQTLKKNFLSNETVGEGPTSRPSPHTHHTHARARHLVGLPTTASANQPATPLTTHRTHFTHHSTSMWSFRSSTSCSSFYSCVTPGMARTHGRTTRSLMC